MCHWCMNRYFVYLKDVLLVLNLKKRRLAKNLSQVTVAKELKITVRMYQYLEAGQRKPGWDVQQRLEQFFDTSASELLAEGEEESSSSKVL